MNVQDMIAMELHEIRAALAGEVKIIRVPGGWIYELWRSVADRPGDWEQYSTVFVPEPSLRAAGVTGRYGMSKGSRTNWADDED